MENNAAINNNDPGMETSGNEIVEFPTEHSSSELPEGNYEVAYSPKVIPMNKFITGFLILMLIMGGIYHFQYRQYAKTLEQQAYVISTAILLYEENLVYGYGVLPEDVGLGDFREAWIDDPCYDTAFAYYEALQDLFEYFENDSPPHIVETILLQSVWR